MEHIAIETCCEALDKLVSADYEGDSQEFEKALERRLNILHYWLEKEENGGLKSSLEFTLQSDDFRWKEDDNINVRLSLTILALLELLRGCLETARTSCPPQSAPTRPPPDELSVQRRRTAARAVQLTVALCVLPALPAGVGVPLEQRSEHADLLRAGGALHGDSYQRREAAVLAARHLISLTGDRSLSAAVLAGHVTDLLALLLLVLHAPLAADGRAGMTPERRQQLLRQRQQLEPQLAPLLARLPDSTVVRELLLLQRCAAQSKPPRRWLHDRAAWWIFQYVRRPGGLASVTEGLLQFWGQDRLDEVPLERVQAVAKLLASPHPGFNNDQYYSHLAAEVVSLLRLRRQEVRVTTLRVAGALSAGLWQSPAGRCAVQAVLLEPLLEPLSAGRPQPASESQLSGGVTAVWQLLVVGSEPGSPCLDGLVPYAAALFQLHAAVRGGVSQLRTPSRELLHRLLRCGRLGEAQQLVDGLLLGEGAGEQRRFALGEAGGVRVEPIPEDEADNWLIEDDDKAAAFAALLGEAATPELISDVFVSLLERMRTVVALDCLAGNMSSPPSSKDALLVWERQQTEKRRAFRHGLLTLRALAALADCEQARVGLEDASRLLPVVQTLLETFCAAGGAEPGLLQVETVCLALGVLAGLLGRESSTAPAWAAARRLLPVLQRLADRQNGSERVRDMATDLQRLVLTNGVIQPSDLHSKPGQHQNLNQQPKLDPDQKPDQHRKPDQDERLDQRLSPDQHIKPDPGQPTSQPQKPGQPPRPLITVLDSQDSGSGMDTDSPPKVTVKTEPPAEAAVAIDERLSPSSDGRCEESAPAAGEASTATSVPSSTLSGPAPAGTDASISASASRPDHLAGRATYQKAMYELVDPLLPVRAHALMSLGRLLERRDPETCRHRQQLLDVFVAKLDDDDSYVYLAAVRGLACLADLFTARVVPALCCQFTGQARHGDTETRLKLAEALVLMVRNLGDLAPHYAPQLLAALLVGCRDGDSLVRASSLSCLGEVCRLLRFSLAGHLQEVFGCLSALLDTDPAVEVRRAAVLLVSQLIDGLGADALKVLEDVLLPLYRRLKMLLRREEDDALLHHVHTALDGLESVTRQMLFPPAPRTLQKRIVVLDPPS